jgi:hypothetical protein
MMQQNREQDVKLYVLLHQRRAATRLGRDHGRRALPAERVSGNARLLPRDQIDEAFMPNLAHEDPKEIGVGPVV